MRKDRSPLAGLQVASPCQQSWEAMRGDDKARFCSHCRLFVYNLSGMSRKEAEALVKSTEGRLCVRFYQRHDGTVLCRDCPVGLRAVRRKLLVLLGTGTAAVVTFGSWLTTALGRQRANVCRPGGTRMPRDSWLRTVEPFASVLNWLDPPPPPQRATVGIMIRPRATMGDVVLPGEEKAE